MSGLLGWSQNTTPSFHRLARGFGNDHLRWPRLSPQYSFEFPHPAAAPVGPRARGLRIRGRRCQRPLASSAPGFVRMWADGRRQCGREAESDEAEQADDPERVRPGGFGGCQKPDASDEAGEGCPGKENL